MFLKKIHPMENFSVIIEKVKKLSFEEKEELQQLLQNYLVEARRDEIYENYLRSRKEENKLQFTNNIKILKRRLRARK